MVLIASQAARHCDPGRVGCELLLPVKASVYALRDEVLFNVEQIIPVKDVGSVLRLSLPGTALQHVN
jgi:hypothetical protein